MNKRKSSHWNENNEKLIKEIGETCKIHKLMHLEMAHKYNKLYNSYMYSGILLGPLAGTLSGIGLSLDCSKHQLISLASTLFGFISGIVMAIVKFGTFDEISNANKQAAARYTSLENNIRRHLSLYRDERNEPYEYLEWLTQKFDDLFNDAPLISTEICKKYETNPSINYITISGEREEDSIKNLISTDEISVNPKEHNESDVVEEKVYYPDTVIKRSEQSGIYSELHKYEDQRMRYELKRFFNFR